MPDKIIACMGDGARIELSPDQVKADILAGTRDAADRGKMPQLDGDADFLAALQAIRELKQIAPAMAVELGMSGEFVLGLHGEIAFDGVRLAGLYPHDQVKMAEAAGADIFGPAVNVKATRSTPWNLARAVTFVKETVRVAGIPVHPNVGMGVCGLPLNESPPIDCTTRAAKALVEIGKADGL